MAQGPAARRIVLSPSSTKELRGLEPEIIRSLRMDLTDPDSKVRVSARQTILALGFTKKDDSAKGIVAFLLDRARKGDFGEHAKAFGHQELAEEEDVEEEYTPPEPPNPFSFDENDPDVIGNGRRKVQSGIPFGALGIDPPEIAPEDDGGPVDVFASYRKDKPGRFSEGTGVGHPTSIDAMRQVVRPPLLREP